MTITPEQKKSIDCILSIFETGKVPTPDSYQTVAVLKDGAGISYGKHQSTDKGGSLDKIVELYIDLNGVYSEPLKSFLPKLLDNETSKVDPENIPSWMKNLIEILKKAGADPIMQKAQDEIFDSFYWNPAVTHAVNIGLKTALGYLVVYDTCIHSGSGGVPMIRAKFPEPPPSKGGDEKSWVIAYIKARRNWLLNHRNPIVQKTVYRQDAMLKIIEEDNWDLQAPLTVRGKKIL